MSILGDIGKVIIGGALGGVPGALIAFTVGDKTGAVVKGTIDLAKQVVVIGKDIYRAIPPEAFVVSGMPIHGLLKHEFEDELILIGELAGEAALIGALTFPALGPIAASAAIAEGAIPLYVSVGSIVGKFHSRRMNDQERGMARYVFGRSLGDLEEILLTNVGGLEGASFVYPSALGTILVNLGKRYVHDATIPDGPVLLHELTHVWQARRRVLREVFLHDLVPAALAKDYDFEPPTASTDREWRDYGTEQQAGIVEGWSLGATRRRSFIFNAGARPKLAMASPLFRFVNGNVRQANEDATTGRGNSVRQLLADGRHDSVRVMHPPPPPPWWP
jgi:hypothetical protein